MSGSTIRDYIYGGYAVAAGVLGDAYQQFRPQSLGAVLAPANYLGTINAAFDGTPAFQFAATAAYGKPIWYVLIDGRQTQPGDYFVGAAGTFYIASQQPTEPIMAILCPRVISVRRPAANTGLGAQPYGGDIEVDEVPIITQWPAAVMQGTKGEKGDTTLPGDVRLPWFDVRVAALNGGVGDAEVQTSDIIYDDLGRRFKISSPEITNLGWRFSALLAEP